MIAFEEPRTIEDLQKTGYANLALTKKNGLDYERVTKAKEHGKKLKMSSFKSFEGEINANFKLKPTEATTRESKRCGALGYKVGMTHFWDKWGKMQPCTVIQLDRCQVTQVKTVEHDGINAIQLGIGQAKLHKMKKPELGHFLKHYLPPKQHLAEFRVTPENFLPVGYCIGPRHFKIGQFVDV